MINRNSDSADFQVCCVADFQVGSAGNGTGGASISKPACEDARPTAFVRTCLRYGLLALALWLQGCASRPAASSSSEPPAPASPPAVKRASWPSGDDTLQKAAAQPVAPWDGDQWKALFDGKTLTGWSETDFAGRGEVQCESGLIVLNMGSPFTGINWTNEFPKMNYEIALDAMRVSGSDFFCGLTVPVADSHCSLIVGGWGGSLIGVSSLDGMDASENETTKFINFEQQRWYRLRLRVTEGRLEGWVDKEKLIDVVTTDKRIAVRPGDIELSRPIGIAAWQTTAALREIKVRPVTGPADKARYN